jgi:hypothetical protein
MQQRMLSEDREPSIQVRKKQLEKNQAELNQDYISANRELNRTTNEVERNRLGRQIKDLEQEIDEVEARLQELEKAENNPNHCSLQRAEKLPEIDFSKIKKTANKIIDKFGKDGGSALFLLQDSHAMAGDLFIAALREQLRSKTGNFRHCRMRFTASEGALDETGILNRLASWFGVQPLAVRDAYIQAIIQAITESVQSGSIVFFELNRWEKLVPQEQILTWFLDRFWQPLVSQLPIKDCPRVKFIAMMTSDIPLLPACLDLPYFCQESRFDGTKILDLPLRKWTVKDIEEWLENFSGLPGPEISRTAKNIHQSSRKGIPQLARDALLKEFE